MFCRYPYKLYRLGLYLCKLVVHRNFKKLPAKVAYFTAQSESFSITNGPKTDILFHKNSSTRYLHIMTLGSGDIPIEKASSVADCGAYTLTKNVTNNLLKPDSFFLYLVNVEMLFLIYYQQLLTIFSLDYHHIIFMNYFRF